MCLNHRWKTRGNLPTRPQCENKAYEIPRRDTGPWTPHRALYWATFFVTLVTLVVIDGDFTVTLWSRNDANVVLTLDCILSQSWYPMPEGGPVRVPQKMLPSENKYAFTFLHCPPFFHFKMWWFLIFNTISCFCSQRIGPEFEHISN